jgi:hypothetical protein
VSLSDATLRSIVNMLADERSAHVAMTKLRDAREGGPADAG